MASAKSQDETYFIVTYREPKKGETVTLKAQSIKDSTLGLGFVCISDFVFNESQFIANPTEENLKKQLENVRSMHLSIYSILTVEEVGFENDGLQFSNDKSNLLVLPNQTGPTPPGANPN